MFCVVQHADTGPRGEGLGSAGFSLASRSLRGPWGKAADF